MGRLSWEDSKALEREETAKRLKKRRWTEKGMWLALLLIVLAILLVP